MTDKMRKKAVIRDEYLMGNFILCILRQGKNIDIRKKLRVISLNEMIKGIKIIDIAAQIEYHGIDCEQEHCNIDWMEEEMQVCQGNGRYRNRPSGLNSWKERGLSTTNRINIP